MAMEKEKPAFGYFFDVVVLRFRRLVLERMGASEEPQEYLEILDGAAKASPDTEDVARFLRKKAELLIRLGNRGDALVSLREAESLAPRLPGLKTLLKRLEA